jgi:hypothetical protein
VSKLFEKYNMYKHNQCTGIFYMMDLQGLINKNLEYLRLTQPAWPLMIGHSHLLPNSDTIAQCNCNIPWSNIPNRFMKSWWAILTCINDHLCQFGWALLVLIPQIGHTTLSTNNYVHLGKKGPLQQLKLVFIEPSFSSKCWETSSTSITVKQQHQLQYILVHQLPEPSSCLFIAWCLSASVMPRANTF